MEQDRSARTRTLKRNMSLHSGPPFCYILCFVIPGFHRDSSKFTQIQRPLHEPAPRRGYTEAYLASCYGEGPIMKLSGPSASPGI